MVNLNSRNSIHPNWGASGAKFLQGFRNCVIAIYAPNFATTSATYDPYANNGSVAPTELWRGNAHVNPFRQTLTVDDVAGSVTHIRSVRITMPLGGPQFRITKGMVIRVLECEEDPDVETYEYIVAGATGGGLSWTRTIDCEVDTSVVTSGAVPNPPIPGPGLFPG